MRDSPISATIDFDRDGVHHGHLRLPHSHDGSAWGSIPIPITMIRRGQGPCALLTGGNHGDEYEGPVALHELACNLSTDEVSGCIFIVPSFNHPAFLAGTRTSPIDQGNMNRVFPGRPDGSATEKIADYFQRTLLPKADVVLDFHSGGKTLDFLPFAASHILEDKEQEKRCRKARDAFNAPFSVEMREIDALGMYDNAAEELGKTFVTTELGGGGTATPYTLNIARKGVRNLLIHAGILHGAPHIEPTVHLSQPDDDCFHFAPCGGLIAFDQPLGQSVRRGDRLAQIWDPHATGQPPFVVLAQRDGMLTARHYPGLIQPGDCLAVLAVPDPT